MWFSDITRRIYPRVGMDLGAATTRVKVLGADGAASTTLTVPTCLALDRSQQRVLAIGEDAANMEGRVGDHVDVLWPVQGGAIADSAPLEAFFQAVLQQLFPSTFFLRPLIMVTVPTTSTEADREIITESLYAVGARDVFTIAQPLAAAIGAGIPIAAASGSLVLQLGASVVEAAVISLSTCVSTAATDTAGTSIDYQIVAHIADQYGIHISNSQARMLKEEHVIVAQQLERSVSVTGRDIEAKAPRTIEVSLEQLRPVVEKVLEEYVVVCRRVLRDVAPELIVDVVDKGMLLTGAGAQLRGVDRFLTPRLSVPVSVVEDPVHAPIDGIMMVLDHLELFKESIGYEA